LSRKPVRRSKQRRRSERPPAPAQGVAERTAADSVGNRTDRWVWLAVAFLFCYAFYFYSFTLPNSNPPVSRLLVWMELPQLLAACVFPSGGGPPSGWQYFPQRLDLLTVAAVIFAGAWGWGHLALRGLRPSLPARCGDRAVLALAVGLSTLSLATLGCGLMGWLSPLPLGGMILAGVLGEGSLRFREARRSRGPELTPSKSAPSIAATQISTSRALASTPTDANSARPTLADRSAESPRWRTLLLAVLAPFLLAMLLGSMLPPTDFDVKEYHLQGPKEFFQLGRITFLPHNVYTSFPFHTEMLSLLAMVLRGDWFRGALAGKAVLMGFAPLTAWAVFAMGRRWFSPGVGWLAAAIYLTTPWTYRLAIIAYVEGGLAFYLAVALLATGLAVEQLRRGRAGTRELLLAGLLAGSAMACKYTGVVQVVIPLGLTACVAAVVWRRAPVAPPTAFLKAALWFGLGTSVTIGPWLVKNLAETGNPVYPLLYTVFDGRDWDEGLNARWRAAHSPHTYALSDLATKFIDVTSKSDWLSPLLFGLAPFSLLALTFRSRPRWLWLYVGYLFLTWWGLTHRIDRFWVPLIPVVAVLAGAGLQWQRHRVWQAGTAVFLATATLFNLAFITTPLCGNNAYLSDLKTARELAETTEMGIRFLNRLNLPSDQKVLCVGAAQVFDARFSVVYNTVFDRSIFQQWCADPSARPDTPEGELPMRPAEEIRRIFGENGVAYIYVNWREILRYRPTYGYTDFVTPERFEWLREHGVLGPPLSMRENGLDPGYGDPEQLQPGERKELETWGRRLLTTIAGQPAFIAAQVFPVASSPTAPPNATDVPNRQDVLPGASPRAVAAASGAHRVANQPPGVAATRCSSFSSVCSKRLP